MARKSTDIDNSDIINLFNMMGIEEYYDDYVCSNDNTLYYVGRFYDP